MDTKTAEMLEKNFETVKNISKILGVEEDSRIKESLTKLENVINRMKANETEEAVCSCDCDACEGMPIADLILDGDSIMVRVPAKDIEETMEDDIEPTEGNFVIKIEEYLSGDTVATYHCNGFNLTDILSDDDASEDGISIFIPQSHLVRVE